MSRPAAFLDRDGTLIRDTGFVRDPQAIELLPTVAAALQMLARHGFARVVISNQSGIARGLLTEADVQAVNAALRARLAAEGAVIDAFYHCPHYDEGCDCRKPLPGMIRTALAEHDLDLAGSVMIGDRGSDVAVAHALGIPGILIENDRYPYAGPLPDHRVRTLLEAARWTAERVRV